MPTTYQDIDLDKLKSLIGKLQSMHVDFEEAMTILQKSSAMPSDRAKLRLLMAQLTVHQIAITSTIDELGGPAFLLSRLASKFLMAASDDIGQQVLINSQHLFHPLPKIDQDELIRRISERG